MNRYNQLENIEIKINKVQELLSKEKDKNILEDAVLELLGEIEEQVGQIIGDKKHRTAPKKEKVFQRYLKMNYIDTNYIGIDNLLDPLIYILYKEVEKTKIKLKYDIFEPGASEIHGGGERKEKVEYKTAQKIKLFQRVLYKIGYNSSQIKQYEEQLNPKRMRQVPYQIFHLQEEKSPKTVLICDQIGQVTFVYDGIISPLEFQELKKGEKNGDILPIRIIYHQNTFETNVDIALNNMYSHSEKVDKIVNEEEEKVDDTIGSLIKKELQRMWKNGEFIESNFGNNWKDFAVQWNEEYGEKKGYQLPISIAGLISKLGGDSKKTLSKKYIICLLEGKEYNELSQISKQALQGMWKKKEFTEKDCGGKWNEFAVIWNRDHSQERGYKLPTSTKGIISQLGGDSNISERKAYIICLLEGREYKEQVKKREVTKKELQGMWKSGEFIESNFGNNWKDFAIQWNEEYGEERCYQLPVSTRGIVSKLGGDSNISIGKAYIICLLEGKEYKEKVKTREITKEEFQGMWKRGEFMEKHCGGKWNGFAVIWNRDHSQERGYKLPTSHHGFIGKLGGDHNISTTREYIICLLEGREYKEQVKKKEITKEEFQSMWKKKEFTEKDLNYVKWSKFIIKWNEEYGEERCYQLPVSTSGIVSKLGGDFNISIGKAYIICLLEGKEYNELRQITKQVLQGMWKRGEFTEKDCGGKWNEFAVMWNRDHSQERGYKLPTSTSGIVSQLGGDFNISTGKAYIICLLEGKEYIEVRKITKQELQGMRKSGEFTESDFGNNWGGFAKKWNEEYGEEKGYLPLSQGSLIRKFGGDVMISMSNTYVICLLEGKEYIKNDK